MRKFNTFLMGMLLVLGGTSLMGQRTCGTMDHLHMQMQQEPGIDRNLAKQEDQIASWVRANGANYRTAGGVVTIPVVVHVVYRTAGQNISDAQVLSQIAVLNEDFRAVNADFGSVPSAWTSIAADTQIEFCMAQRDPQGNPTNGIRRVQTTVNSFSLNDAVKYTAQGGDDAWPRDSYLNFWVCNLGGGLLGYSQFPGSGAAATDGVVIGYNFFGRTGAVSAPYNKGRTATHEVGHWLNLRHIWGDDGGSCSGTDQVTDTPNQGGENYGCPNIPTLDNCQPAAPGVMSMNYMDYTDDACMYFFTQGQSTRMMAVLNGTRAALQNSMGCVPVQLFTDDAGVTSIPSPTGTICSDQITPSAVIKNFGSNTITSMMINWQIDSGTLQNQAWTGTLASQASITVTMPSQLVTSGAHTITMFTSLPNGNADGNSANDSDAGTFNSAASGQALPFAYAFAAVTWPPTGWAINNPDNATTWAYKGTVGYNGNGCAWVDNYNYQDRGQRDELVLPSVDLSSAGNADLTWDLSYVLYTSQGYSDTLLVYASTNCGVSWTNIYTKAGQALTTVTPYYLGSAFTPNNPNQWRNESVSLSSLVGNSSVLLKFVNATDYENNLYIDNVNINTSAVGVTQSTLSNAVTVFPNPSDGQFRVKIALPSATDVNLMVYNVIGKQVVARSLKGFTNGELDFDLSTEAAGVYFLRVESEGTTIVKRIAVQ